MKIIKMPLAFLLLLGAIISIKDTGSYNRYFFFALCWCLLLTGYAVYI